MRVTYRCSDKKNHTPFRAAALKRDSSYSTSCLQAGESLGYPRPGAEGKKINHGRSLGFLNLGFFILYQHHTKIPETC